MLVKQTDFIGLYYVPNATDTAPYSNSLGNKLEIMEYVDTYEKEAIHTVLGVTLGDLLIAELSKKPFDENSSETAEQKWIDLVKGTGKYRGMKEALIAYCFYKFYEDDQTRYTGIGERTVNGSNQEVADPTPRAVKVWRRFHELTIGNSSESQVIAKSYGVGIVWGDSASPYHSLYKFLNDNKDTYPEWEPTYFDNMNQYGI